MDRQAGARGPCSHILLGRVGLRVGAGCTVPSFALTSRTGAREQCTSQEGQSRPCPANEDGRTKLVPVERGDWGQKTLACLSLPQDPMSPWEEGLPYLLNIRGDQRVIKVCDNLVAIPGASYQSSKT